VQRDFLITLYKNILISFDMCYFHLFCTILGTYILKTAIKMNISDVSIILVFLFSLHALLYKHKIGTVLISLPSTVT